MLAQELIVIVFLDLHKTGIVWFIDCDMHVETENIADILRQKFAAGNHIMLGSTILYANGQPRRQIGRASCRERV